MNRNKHRKLAAKLKKHSKSIFYVIFVFLAITSTAFAIPSQLLGIMGTATINPLPTFNCNNLSANYSQQNSWRDGNQTKTSFTLKLNNLSNVNFVNWKGAIAGPHDLDFQYNWGNTHYYSNEFGETIFAPSDANVPANGSTTITGLFSTSRNTINIRYIRIGECIVYGDVNAPDEEEGEDTPPLTGLIVSPETYTMTIGERFTITGTKRPGNAEGTISWSSSNQSVASITQTGLITAISAGTATITASCGGFTATSRITVVEPFNEDDISIRFTRNASWGQSINFVIRIENHSLVSISELIFLLNMPTGSNYMVWSNNTSNNGNIFTVRETLMPGGSKEINGQIDLPNGYNVADYFSATSSIISVR